ncbi:MAG: CBS domain-containing protein [Pseudomonadota bacterium]
MNIQDRIEFRSKPKPLKTVDSTTVADAVAMMTERNFGSIIATGADGRMTGLFTERDVMRRVVNEGRDPKTTPLADVMTKEVRVAKADDDVVDWLRTMSNERFRRLPVVDETGDVVAIMTQGDFVSYTWPDLIARVNDQLNKAVPWNFQATIIGVGVLVYSLALVWFLN